MHFETIFDVGKMLRSGEITSTELTKLMLDRIGKHNNRLNAFITVTSELALAQARQADKELSAGNIKGPLHGIPVAVKDLFATRGVLTTCGSRLFENRIPDHDATVVKRLADAGAVLLGKTGLDELAYGTTSINPFYGAVHNPWALDHDAGGSSGGSASAVAAGLAYAALGTDTGCSIRQPAHCCGIVGYKPTFGLVSKAGVFPLVRSMDHVGCLTRSVQDTASVISSIAGFDSCDPYSVHAPHSGLFDVGNRTLNGAKIGVVRRFFFEGRSDVLDRAEESLKALSELGATLVELDIPDIEDAFACVRTTFAEAATLHAQDLKDRPHGFSDGMQRKLEADLDMKAIKYIEAQHFRRDFTMRIEQLLGECDILVAPTATITAAPIDKRPQDYGRLAWKNTGIFNFTGQPSISVPCGFTEVGLPVGLMFTGALYQDNTVMQLAHAFCQATGGLQKHPNI